LLGHGIVVIRADSSGVPCDGDLFLAFDHSGHVAVGVLDFRAPLYLVSAVHTIALNTDVVEGYFLFRWVHMAGPGLLEHNVRESELLAVLALHNLLRNLTGFYDGLRQVVGVGGCFVLNLTMEGLSGVNADLPRVRVVNWAPLEVLRVH